MNVKIGDTVVHIIEGRRSEPYRRECKVVNISETMIMIDQCVTSPVCVKFYKNGRNIIGVDYGGYIHLLEK